MELELDFFQAAVKDAKQPRIGLLVLDFDETLSVSDTTSVIIDTAIRLAEAASNGKPMRAIHALSWMCLLPFANLQPGADSHFSRILAVLSPAREAQVRLCSC